jgi:hypothetical protein
VAFLSFVRYWASPKLDQNATETSTFSSRIFPNLANVRAQSPGSDKIPLEITERTGST